MGPLGNVEPDAVNFIRRHGLPVRAAYNDGIEVQMHDLVWMDDGGGADVVGVDAPGGRVTVHRSTGLDRSVPIRSVRFYRRRNLTLHEQALALRASRALRERIYGIRRADGDLLFVSRRGLQDKSDVVIAL